MWHRSIEGMRGRRARWCIFTLLLAGICGLAPEARAQGFNTLYSFAGNDGTSLDAPLVQAADGTLYSTTYNGGSAWSPYGKAGWGEIFSTSTTGAFTLIHPFDFSDGANPVGGLLMTADGVMYGAAQYGSLDAIKDYGMLFRATPDSYKVMYIFSGKDGRAPTGGLVQTTDGTLYGTTSYGGANDTGTVFKLATNGSLTTLHSFSVTGASDGQAPVTPLVQAGDGAFYGVTGTGGAHGNGAIFRITDVGSLTLLHSFDGPNEVSDGYGELRIGALVLGRDGALYGATTTGGTNGTGGIYRITTGGAYTIIHSFGAISASSTPTNPMNADGMFPMGVLAGRDGAFYGATAQGGVTGGGTLFRLNAAGSFTLLHTLDSPVEAANTGNYYPWVAPMMAADGNLYGTTIVGGVDGYGAIYQLILPAYLMSVSLSPANLAGGNSSIVTVTLTKPAPTGGAVVKLTSSSKSAVPPASITIAAGQASGQGTVKTSSVSTVTNVTITASYNGDSASDALQLSPPGVTGVSLKPADVVGGNSAAATVTLSGPAPAGGITLSLSSSSSYASVPSSVAVGAGKTSVSVTVTTKRVTSNTVATIKASYASTSAKAGLNIDIQTFKVTPSAGSNGSIGPNIAQTVDYGNSISFTAKPTTGYIVNQWLLDGKAVSGATGTTYKLSNVTANHTVKVTFEAQTFTVTPSAGANGSISPNTAQTVKYGGSVTFKATPASGYKVNQWTLDGTAVQAGGSSYTLSGVKASHKVSVTFK